MAVMPMQKVRIFVHKSQRESFLDFVQTEGYLEIVGNEQEQLLNPADLKIILDKEQHEVEFDLAKLEFVLNYLKKYDQTKLTFREQIEGSFIETDFNKVREIVNQFSYKDIIGQIESIDGEIVRLDNAQKELAEEEKLLAPFQKFNFTLAAARETKHTRMLVGQIDIRDYELFITDLIKTTPYVHCKQISKTESASYVYLIFLKEIEKKVDSVLQDFKFSESEFSLRQGSPAEELKNIQQERKEIYHQKNKLEKELEKLTKHLINFKIIYDYLIWVRDKKINRKKFQFTTTTEIVVGWLPQKNVRRFKHKLKKEFKVIAVEEIDAGEGEMAPVVLSNKKFIEPFESVTNVYGLPLYSDVDPTPFLSTFFIVFFGMCLSDAGYGLTLFLITFLSLMFFDLPQGIKKMFRLLMYGGVFTFIFGVLYGGWFGITTQTAPSFLLTESISGEIVFIGQYFNPMQNPLSILILSLFLGVFQVWVGIAVNFYWKIKQRKIWDAILDSGVWLYFLAVLILYVLTAIDVLSSSYKQIMLNLIYVGIFILVVTQGRAQKGIIAKIGIGILSLYSLVGYFSDVLSYSRILALGLATGIIAFAVNSIAGLAFDIPYVGFFLAFLVLVGGHIFNLALSALGAFIHSARLQFVEFFGKFMEGGGTPFNPFIKVCKYIKLVGSNNN
jgi:V/A-type H+-transporting ATPase subunit I